jgi:hypothetical protein
VYAYSQPFWRNFYFLNKIFFFFYQAIVLFEFLFKNCMQSTVDNNRIIKNKQINKIVYYVMRSKNEVLCAAAGRLAAERSEADKPAKAC